MKNACFYCSMKWLENVVILVMLKSMQVCWILQTQIRKYLISHENRYTISNACSKTSTCFPKIQIIRCIVRYIYYVPMPGDIHLVTYHVIYTTAIRLKHTQKKRRKSFFQKSLRPITIKRPNIWKHYVFHLFSCKTWVFEIRCIHGCYI
jgi:hypothetical protein